MPQSTRETIADYLRRNSARIQAVLKNDDAIRVDLNVPASWIGIDSDTVPDAYFIAVDPAGTVEGFTPNVVVFVARYELHAGIETALQAAFADAYVLPGWKSLREDHAAYQGFSSAYIAGKYQFQSLELFAENRYALALQGDWTYLVQATYTTTGLNRFPAVSVVDTLKIDLAED